MPRQPQHARRPHLHRSGGRPLAFRPARRRGAAAAGVRRRAGVPGGDRAGGARVDRRGRDPPRRRPAARRAAHQRDRRGGDRAEVPGRAPLRLSRPPAGRAADGRVRGRHPVRRARGQGGRVHPAGARAWPTSSAPPPGPARCSRCWAGGHPELGTCAGGSGPIIQELDTPRPLVAGWFAASAAGCLFSSTEGEPTYRYIEVGLES